jgi:hypothetical protein
MAKKPQLKLLLTFLLFAGAAQAMAECTAWHHRGAMVAARERAGATIAWAHASYDPDGWPAITYGPVFYEMPRLMQEFTKLHECMHLNLHTTDEIKANCQALLSMRRRGLSEADEELIARFHVQFPVMAAQYGGSGPAFWSATVDCAGAR